jgi:hypothetical protein
MSAGGGGEIRTHEAFRPSGFQDRRNQPLCHPSAAQTIGENSAITAKFSKRSAVKHDDDNFKKVPRQRNMFM